MSERLKESNHHNLGFTHIMQNNVVLNGSVRFLGTETATATEHQWFGVIFFVRFLFFSAVVRYFLIQLAVFSFANPPLFVCAYINI